MAKIKFDIVVTRTDPKSDKKFRTNIGRVFENDRGLSIKIDTIPLNWDGWAGLWEPREKASNTFKLDGKSIDEDVPF